MKITARDQQIFTAVMSLYCDSEGNPVASSKIAKQKGMAVCSATVRNVMARLEREGLLYSPHTSAGRVPTEAGFKYWFEEFFELPEMANYWQPQQSELVEFAHGLSQKYQVCCCVGLPQASSRLVFRVEVLGFDSESWLVLLIDKAGQSHNICINKPQNDSDALRYQFAAWMNSVFSQQTLIEGLHRMRAMANCAPSECHDQLAQWTRELSQQLGTDNSIVVGERYLYQSMELETELNIGVPFLHQVEDRLAFKNGVSILFGNELNTLNIEDVLVLSLPYFTDGEYQSRFCVICPAYAPIEALIGEFSQIDTFGA